MELMVTQAKNYYASYASINLSDPLIDLQAIEKLKMPGTMGNARYSPASKDQSC
jgi:hypothetical protein